MPFSHLEFGELPNRGFDPNRQTIGKRSAKRFWLEHSEIHRKIAFLQEDLENNQVSNSGRR
jgi:hypothetical protein